MYFSTMGAEPKYASTIHHFIGVSNSIHRLVRALTLIGILNVYFYSAIHKQSSQLLTQSETPF